MARNPFQPIIEALEAMRWEPSNAREVIAWYEGLEHVNDAYAGLLKRQAQTLDETFKQDNAASVAAHEFGGQAARMSGSAADARSIFLRAHREKLENLEDTHAGADKWDISKNRG